MFLKENNTEALIRLGLLHYPSILIIHLIIQRMCLKGLNEPANV